MSLAAIQARERPKAVFCEPNRKDHSDWIMLVMLLSYVKQPTFQRYVCHRPGSGAPGLAGRIVDAVTDLAGLKEGALLSDRRARAIAWPRQVAMYLMKEHTNMSLPAIGNKVRKSHWTVMHGCEAVEKRVEDGDENTLYLIHQTRLRLDLRQRWPTRGWE